jgi:hypothetical protein
VSSLLSPHEQCRMKELSPLMMPLITRSAICAIPVPLRICRRSVRHQPIRGLRIEEPVVALAGNLAASAGTHSWFFALYPGIHFCSFLAAPWLLPPRTPAGDHSLGVFSLFSPSLQTCAYLKDHSLLAYPRHIHTSPFPYRADA